MPDAIQQMILKYEYQRLAESGTLPDIHDTGAKVYSQNDEDGILLYLFSVLGSPTKRCVEICAGNGIECNTANLIVNHGWDGLLVDGNLDNVRQGRKFYSEHPNTHYYPPVFISNWVKRGNVNELITANGFAGRIDLLSIDLDGMDYWIWQAINVVTPRVVVIEFQRLLGPTVSQTVPYSDDFKYTPGNDFFGASLSAMTKLALDKGYYLVGVNRRVFNAFFVRMGITSHIKPISPTECFDRVPARLPCSMPDKHPWIDV